MLEKTNKQVKTPIHRLRRDSGTGPLVSRNTLNTLLLTSLKMVVGWLVKKEQNKNKQTPKQNPVGMILCISYQRDSALAVPAESCTCKQTRSRTRSRIIQAWYFACTSMARISRQNSTRHSLFKFGIRYSSFTFLIQVWQTVLPCSKGFLFIEGYK